MKTLQEYKNEIISKTKHSIPDGYFDSYFNSFSSSYYEIYPFLEKNKKILDVGCGPGLLVNKLKQEGFRIKGFDNYLYNPHTKAINEIINLSEDVQNTDIQNFFSNEKFDIIFLSNVIEHLNDWKQYSKYLNSFLEDEGIIILLLPNYNFPVEIHFMLPIIYNKSLTFKIFKNKIIEFEKKHQRHGLWDSLNFIKPKDILKHYSDQNYHVKFEKRYFQNLLERLIINSKHHKNHYKKNIINRLLIFISILFSSAGIIKIYRYLPLFFHPFIKIIIKKNRQI